MVTPAETRPLQPESLRPPLPKEWNPLRHDQEIAAEQESFWRFFEMCKDKLTAENLRTEVPRIAQNIMEQPNRHPLEQATNYFALATAAEVVRTGHHTPNWQQAEAALHMIFPYEDGTIQRLQMATGEGKTFTIALASLWEAAHGKYVTIHTDKKANVEQSHTKMAGLFDVFAASHGVVMDNAEIDEDSEDYINYLNGKPPFAELPRIRYGTWAQGMHEYLHRQQIIFQTQALLNGDFENVRNGTWKVMPELRAQLEESLAYQKRMLRPDVITADEGDLSVDMEDSPVVVSSPDSVGFSTREENELQLVWDLFDDRADSFPQIAAALKYDQDKLRKRFELKPEHAVEGLQPKSAPYTVTSEGVDLQTETFYASKLLEATVLPGKLSRMLSLMQEQYRDGVLAQLPLQAEQVKKLRSIADRAFFASVDIDWGEVEEVLPPLTYQDITAFLQTDKLIFDYKNVLSAHPELRRLLRKSDRPLQAADLEVIEAVFADPDEFFQRLTIHRMQRVLSVVWEPLFNRFSHDLLEVKHMMTEGNRYQLVKHDDGVEAVVLGDDRQPQPGKEFEGNIQAFIHLKHNLPLSPPTRTVAQILPLTWYQTMARRGSKVASLSGTQDEPDFIVESTGENTVDVLETRLFENTEQKIRAVVAYIDGRADVPILLCAQNYAELKLLETQLAKLPGRELLVLDAQHADEAEQLVPSLEKGKILLLQITARGLDFGRLLGDTADGGRHSFEDGLIINAEQLPDTHQQKQTEGRLGGKRPKGKVVTMTSLDGKLAQELYTVTPELAQKRHQKMRELNTAYLDFAAQKELLNWPDSLSEALSAVIAWEEAHPDDDGATPPQWMAYAMEQKPFHTLINELTALQRRHMRDLEKQQDRNLRKRYENRRNRMVVDAVVQVLWQTMMLPTDATELGKVMLPLSYERRQELVERLFDEAEDHFPLSANVAKIDPLASNVVNERNRMAQFMKDMVDRVKMWVELEELDGQYRTMVLDGKLMTPPLLLPDDINLLEGWLRKRQETLHPRRLLTTVIANLMRGAQLFADPNNPELIPPALAPVSPEERKRANFLEKLTQINAKTSAFRRTYASEV